MLAKPYRLTKNKDFERVAKKGESAYARELALKWIKNNLDYSRFGIVCSLKVSKKAVVRNKIKRRIRAILREKLGEIEKSFDFMILTKPEIKNLDYKQIKTKLLGLFEKIDLL